MGYEREMLGGNIACAKRGLKAANDALGWLKEMKGARFLSQPQYMHFYEQTFEVRNNLGIYVQDLRGRFDNRRTAAACKQE